MVNPKSTLRKRKEVYYLHYFEHGVRKRLSLGTDSLRIAQEKQRQFDSARVRGYDNPLPTQTPVPRIVQAYIRHMRVRRTKHGVTAEVSRLRKLFGPICPELEHGQRCRKELRIPVDGRLREPVIAAVYLEQITTEQIAEFIRERVQRYNLEPKTANGYRAGMQRLFNWATEEGGVRMPGGKNPAVGVRRYRERAPQIRFLTKQQIQEQLEGLTGTQMLQTMVAVYIYAGLRREETLWLTCEDVDLKAGKHGVLRIRAKTTEKGEFWEPKTKVNRVVPISRALRSYLDRYEVPLVSGRWFFSSPEGCRWDADNFYQHLRRVNEAAGLAWSCLDYRHTFGSHLAMKGESLYKISALMGNSPEICRRHYATLLPESLVQSVEFDEEEEAQAPKPKTRRTRHPHLRLIVNEDG